MPTRRQLIQKISLNSDAASVSFTGIPQNFNALKIVVSGRSTISASATDLFMGINGSTSGFTTRFVYGNGASALSSAQSQRYAGTLTGATATANTFSSNEIAIPNYTSAINKSISSIAVAENNGTTAYNLLFSTIWANTSAITSLEFASNSGNLASGSTFYLYGITHVPIINGGEVSIRDGFKYHTFRSTSTLQVVEPGDVEYLVVAGGGAAANGARFAGGGGAGGLLNARTRLSTGLHSVTVGAGGTVSATVSACNGSNTSLGSITATGGGGGSVESSSATVGGSGGGGHGGLTGNPGAAGTSGQGNSGGSGNTATYRTAGGGGGAGSTGSNGAQSGGNGGSGRNIFGTTYAGGGGGSAYENTDATGDPGIGGSGGGGTGGRYRTTNGAASYNAASGGPNTGGGGGGGAWHGNGSNSANGGSGIVVIRYPYDGN